MADGSKIAIGLIAAVAGAVLVTAAAMTAAILRPEWSLASLALGFVASLAALGALSALRSRVLLLFDGLARLRGDLAAVIARRTPAGRPDEDEEIDPDVATLVDLAADVGGSMAETDTLHDDRLAAVVAVLGEAVVVATDTGQVSLVSAAAKALLGPERVAVGTSLYAALDRESASYAAEHAEADGEPVEVEIMLAGGGAVIARVAALGGSQGTVYSFAGQDSVFSRAVDHDLSLHDLAPLPIAFDDDTPLRELPVVVLDLETTGLDAQNDRMVSIGAVRARGNRLYRGDVFDWLVAPGIRIPERSTKIHGITDAMVAEAPPFAALHGEILHFIVGQIVVGHNIGFDLAVLAAESERADCPWPAPQSIDLLRIAAMLEPRQTDMTLDATARRWGVAISGRHTALGDALVTAELWSSAVARLASAGVTTFGEALAYQSQAKSVIARQKELGW
jgi:DNA polymerase-3 subunit epsilon